MKTNKRILIAFSLLSFLVWEARNGWSNDRASEELTAVFIRQRQFAARTLQTMMHQDPLSSAVVPVAGLFSSVVAIEMVSDEKQKPLLRKLLTSNPNDYEKWKDATPKALKLLRSLPAFQVHQALWHGAKSPIKEIPATRPGEKVKTPLDEFEMPVYLLGADSQTNAALVEHWAQGKLTPVGNMVGQNSMSRWGLNGANIQLFVTTLSTLNASWAQPFTKIETGTFVTKRTVVNPNASFLVGTLKDVAYQSDTGYEALWLPLNPSRVAVLLVLPPVDGPMQDAINKTNALLSSKGWNTKTVSLKLPTAFVSNGGARFDKAFRAMMGGLTPSKSGGESQPEYLHLNTVAEFEFFQGGIRAYSATHNSKSDNKPGYDIGDAPGQSTNEIRVTFDRPFLFVVVDDASNSILYFGTVMTA